MFTIKGCITETVMGMQTAAKRLEELQARLEAAEHELLPDVKKQAIEQIGDQYAFICKQMVDYTNQYHKLTR